ncbi:MAG: amidohydrolase family protein [Salinirussus sp.]
MSKHAAESPVIDADFGDVTVIDSDVHPSYASPEVQRDLASRMDEPYASFLHPDRRGDSPYPDHGWPETVGGHRSGPMLRQLQSHDDIRSGLLDRGMDAAIVNQISFIDAARGTERAIQEMRAANEVLLDRYVADDDDVYGLLNLAMRAPEAAAEEIDRYGHRDDIVGAVVFPGGEYQKPLGNPEYDVVHAAAEDNDVTMVYHAVDDMMPARQAPVLNDAESFLTMHTLAFPWTAMLTLTSLIVEGVPVKFPDLNFVILEAGLGWIPYMMGRLNREVSWRKSDAPLLERSPEAYIRDRFWFGTQPVEEHENSAHLHETMRAIGAENLLFTSDYPHWDFDNPASIDQHLTAAFSTEEREQVLSDNARVAFGFDP